MDYLKSLSFNSKGYYAQSITHPLKFSPCWTFGTLVVSIFNLFHFFHILYIFLLKLELHELIISVSLSHHLLRKSQAQPWLSLSSICTIAILKLDSSLFLNSKVMLFLLSVGYFHMSITCVFHEGHNSYVNICTLAINGFLSLICVM